ncbi:MAG: hypothetical protein JWM82_3287, partial [Myxococcales bacterium]|nr:hypothetical protein [Myxococcales bacterium]
GFATPPGPQAASAAPASTKIRGARESFMSAQCRRRAAPPAGAPIGPQGGYLASNIFSTGTTRTFSLRIFRGNFSMSLSCASISGAVPFVS